MKSPGRPSRKVPVHVLRAAVVGDLIHAPRGVIPVRRLDTTELEAGCPVAPEVVSPLLDLLARVRARRSGRPIHGDTALREAVKDLLTRWGIDTLRLGNMTLTLGPNRTTKAGDELLLLARPLRVVVAKRVVARAPKAPRATAPVVAATGINMDRVREALAARPTATVIDMAAHRAARKAV